jgi:hypothetical protein
VERLLRFADAIEINNLLILPQVTISAGAVAINGSGDILLSSLRRFYEVGLRVVH